jgi:cobalt-zinc-cadmium efflux system membrane fusion protein
MIQDNRKLLAAAAVFALLGTASGYALFRFTHVEPTPAAASEEDKVAKAANVSVTADQIRNANIGVQAVATSSVGGEVVAQAAVVASPTGAAILTAHASGTITRIFKRIGEPVRAGEVLAVVEGKDAAQIAADRSSAGAKSTLAARNLAREKSLFEQGITSRAAYEQAEAEAAAASAETQRARATAGTANITGDGRGVAVVSPITGAVTASTATLGAFVQSETELFHISDPKNFQIEASISAEDIGLVSVSDKALLETTDKQVFNATVRSITPALDATTRVATAILDAPGASLRPGQTVRARIISGKSSQSRALTVPDDAIQNVEGRQVVFVRTEKGFTTRTVLPGRQGAGRTEILRGLRSDEQIAVRNAFVLKAELGKSAEEE